MSSDVDLSKNKSAHWFQHKEFHQTFLKMLSFKKYEIVEKTNPAIWRGNLYNFQNALLIFMLFWNKCGTAITAGKHSEKF